MKDALADLRQQAIETNLALTSIALSSATTAASLDALRGATTASTASTTASGTAATAAGFSFLGMSGAVLALVGAITAGVILFSPFIAVIVAATVIMTAFTAGVAAVGSTLLLALGPLGLMAAAVIMLADRLFTTGKILADPLLGLEQNFSRVADTLGKQALPMALQMIDVLNKMIPAIQSAGQQMLTWFGQQIPGILKVVSDTTHALSDEFNRAWPILTGFLNTMIGQLPQFEGFWRQLLNVGVQAIQGLVTNLLALSDWFLNRLPAMAPIVASIMGGIGSAIQGMGSVFGQVVDFFVKNWSAISSAANQAWQSIVAGWNFVAPILGPVAQTTLSELSRLFQYGANNADALRGVMFAVGVVAASLAVILLGLVIAVSNIAGALIVLVQIVQSVATWFDNAAGAVGRFLSLFQQANALMRGSPLPSSGGSSNFPPYGSGGPTGSPGVPPPPIPAAPPSSGGGGGGIGVAPSVVSGMRRAGGMTVVQHIYGGSSAEVAQLSLQGLSRLLA